MGRWSNNAAAAASLCCLPMYVRASNRTGSLVRKSALDSDLPKFVSSLAKSLAGWIIGFVLVSSPSAADTVCPEDAEITRPKIGLVLGGGGARGAAHIGVIKKLEELNIPIDYVAGTSMGALVGALYATGMNADELDRTIRSLEWGDLFNDNVTRVDRPFRRKRDDDLSLFGPKFGVGRDSTFLRRGAISGQKISFLFESLVHDRVQVDDFDDLPVPFRAVAADIATGRVVVLDSGNLALAMRASMSVPGVFDPVELNGHLLVDGGIVNNVPVDVVRSMGADRLIVVDVGSPLTPRDELNNLLSVLGQMTGMLIRNNVEAQLATLNKGDLLIRPNLVDVTSVDFAKSSEAIDIGYRAANELSEGLASFSVTAAEHQAHRLRIESCTPPPNVIQFVRLNNQSRFSDSMILARLRIEEGQPLNTETLEEDIKQIYALGFLELVRYEVVSENAQTGVVVHVTQDSRGTAFVQLGLDYSGDQRNSQLNVRLSYLKTDLDELGSELRVLTQFGNDPGLLAEIYKPLSTHRRWIINPKLFVARSDITTYDRSGNALETFQIDEVGGSARLMREIGNHAAVFVGVGRVSGSVDVETGDPAFRNVNFNDGGFFAGIQWDRMDDLYLPNSGVFVDARYSRSLESLGADLEYEQLRINAGIARTFGRHTVIGIARYATTLDNDAPVYGLFRAGGFAHMTGFNDDELIGQHFAMGLLSYRFEIDRQGFWPAYVGASIEHGNVADFRHELFDDAVFSGSAYFGYRSPIGPLYMGYGFIEGGRERFFVRIGNVFGRGNITR